MPTISVAQTGLDTTVGQPTSFFVDPVPLMLNTWYPFANGTELYFYSGANGINYSFHFEGSGLTADFVGSTLVVGGTIDSMTLGGVWYSAFHVPTMHVVNNIEYTNLSISGADFTTALSTFQTSGDRSFLDALFLMPATTFLGGYGADLFRANSGNDALLGFAGNDTLVGNGGDDYIHGGADHDVLVALDGADLIFGDVGSDSAWGGNGNDIALLGDGSDTAFGEAGDDLIFGEGGSDTLLGGEGADFVAGGAGDDYAWGENGADYLMGESGNDAMFGGDGNDVLVGGADADILYGESGSDGLFGGAGNDYYIGGAGADFFYVAHDGPTSGEMDIVEGFEAASSGTADWMVLPLAYKGVTSFFDSGGYAWVSITVSGGTHYVAVTGASAATIETQTIWS